MAKKDVQIIIIIIQCRELLIKLHRYISISTHARIYHFKAKASSATTVPPRSQALVKILVVTTSILAMAIIALKCTA